MAALLALILWASLPYVKQLFHAVSFHIPLVGGLADDVIDSAINVVVSNLESWISDSLVAFANFLWAMFIPLWAHLAQVVNGIIDAKTQGVQAMHTAQAAVPAANAYTNAVAAQLQSGINQDATTAAAAEDATRAALASGLAQAQAASDAYTNAVAAQLQSGINQAAAAAASADDATRASLPGVQAAAVAQANAFTEQQIAQANALTAALIAGNAAAAQSALAALAASVPATAAGITSTAEAGIAQAAHDLVIGPWTALLPDLGAIGNAIPAAQAQVLGLPGTLTDGVPISIPGIQALTITAVGAIASEVARCVIPQCTNLGGLSTLLGNLLDDAFWVLLLALIVEAAHNPGEVVSDIESTLSGTVQSTARTFMDLIGV